MKDPMLPLLVSIALSVALAQPLAAQVITLDPASVGRTFQGIGAVSAGASSRLLIDYPEHQRSQILDLLFKPHYGASFQHLKVEIGGDINSTDGTEPSFMRNRDEEDDNRGYEWWLMKEAQKRNPNIIFDCLAWGAPAWIGSGKAEQRDFFTQDMADYLVRFLKAARSVHHLNIRYVGIWNERPYSIPWIKLLRTTLDRNGLTDVRIAAADQINNWTLASEMASDPDLRAAVASLAVHYPRFTSTPDARGLGLPLWASEDGPWKGTWDGAAELARTYNRNYVQGRMTTTEIWSPITSYYDVLPLPGSGVMRANTPWSGAYEVQPALWATAMTTQFVQPWWRYLDQACTLISGGSVVALTSPSGRDLSIIVETTESKDTQKLTFHVAAGLATTSLHVWRTTEREQLVELASVPIHDHSFTVSFDPGAIYTLTTTNGQHKGTPTPPSASAFPLPYREGFEEDRSGTTPRFLSDQAGAFEVVDRSDGNGHALRQVIVQRGIEWQKNPYPETIFGDKNWTDYELSLDTLIHPRNNSTDHASQPNDPSHPEPIARFVSLFGRIRSIHQDGTPPIGYWLKVEDTRKWELSVEREKSGNPDKNGRPRQVAFRTVLASGLHPLTAGSWHTVKLRFEGSHIAAAMDGEELANVVDSNIGAGMAGFGCGWHSAEFDNLSISPFPAAHR